MLKQSAEILRKVVIALDMCLAAGAFILGCYATMAIVTDAQPVGHYFRYLPVFVVFWGGMLYFLGMYESFRAKKISDVLAIIAETAMIGIGASGILVYFFAVTDMGKGFLFFTFGIMSVIIIAEKTALMLLFRFIRKKGYNTRHLLIVGTGSKAINFLKVVKEHDEWGYKIIGLIDDERVGKSFEGFKVLGTLKDIPDILHKNVVDEVIFMVQRAGLVKIEEAIRACELEGIKVSISVDYFDAQLSRIQQTELHGFRMLTFESAPTRIWALFIKRLFDVTASALALVVLSPVFLAIAVAIKATSKGPVFFRQERCGLNSRKFTLYKFRTMTDDAESRLAELLLHNEMRGPVFKLKNDPRITKIGGILRKLSIDELPQLWNVFKGDMSLVGPRPPIPAEVAKYESWHRRRLSMRPGLTCLWQVSGRNKITNFDEWAKLDLKYIDEWSIWLDIRILFKTIPVVLFGIGAK